VNALMIFLTILLLVLLALLLVAQLVSTFGRLRGLFLGLLVVGLFGAIWGFLSIGCTMEEPAWSQVASVPSTACIKCHQEHYDSWHRTYHRTMTREATPEYVKGDFNNIVYDYQGLKTRFHRVGHRYVMETVDPKWALLRAQAKEGDRLPPPRYVPFTVDRLVGSHWVQECMHKAPNGQFIRLPVVYHIVEKRWVHAHGAFLAPETSDFWGKSRGFAWNDTCLYCHNTGPSKNPVLSKDGKQIGYETSTAELGISCEACHGPAGEHVRLNANPARRYVLQQSGQGDPSIIHPARLSVPRRDEICARCHGAFWPKEEMWDPLTMRDPFIAGQELGRVNHFYSSEAELAVFARRDRPTKPLPPEPTDGRFWGDGTPLTTALEYNGMALSACYLQGRGQLSCLSCHQLHTDDPNFLLKPGMQTNEACYQCHESYRDRLIAHTKHPADSAGSLCYNCHMPHQVYSLFTTHRSHRIQNPEIKDSLGTGKPHACNLCHLDRSLGWTQEQLSRWPDRSTKNRQKLSKKEEITSSALLMLTGGDARSRAIVAGAFSNQAARKASGTDWFGPFLTRLIEHERYPVVRYLMHRGLRDLPGESAVGEYDYLGLPAQRRDQVRALRARFDQPIRRPLPGLPMTKDGHPDERVLRKLVEQRNDPDLTINE
jgi:predicted CXXCH cytochrome family protein